MIAISLVIAAAVILLLRHFGIVKYPFVIFAAAVLIVGISAFIFKDRLNCPFAKDCPFSICPLNQGKSKDKIKDREYPAREMKGGWLNKDGKLLGTGSMIEEEKNSEKIKKE